MALRQPENMGELVYFTRRATADGKVVAWVFREECPKCHKSLMGKPRGEEGKIQIRSKEYVCPKCSYTVDKDYEDGLTVNIEYTCGKCGFTGEAQTPYKRKTYMGVKALVFECERCKAPIPITKKMKEPKKKKGPKLPDTEDDE